MISPNPHSKSKSTAFVYMSNNIQVVVRCRGRNEREITAKSQIITEFHTNDSITITNKSSQLSQQIINSVDSKTYKFDQVYGPGSDQQAIFDNSVKPLFQQFMAGFNVTVLAYGQTGTGKTYTMCGEQDGTKDSGIIPRVLSELFHNLSDDFMIKCSFLELYNETLKDLLDAEASGLKIYENKKNSNSIQISNLKEVAINDLESGFNVLNKGLLERKVASTKLNNFSSRSHTIFTIHLYKKKSGTESFKYSKINLVDLAGSENINKSGSINVRAKEAGSINQSLLTLGRVINSLSGKNPQNVSNNHIPYRESKLTRLLQDSIGGKTKTLLISTISPAKINLEETLSTLEYSLKVKNIENKPQLGQDFSIFMKQTLIKDLSNEIIKLNNDLVSTRAKNGIFMNEINYRKLNDEITSSKNEVDELKLKLANSEKKLESYERMINDYETNERNLTHEINELHKVNQGLESRFADLNDNVIQSINVINSIMETTKNHQFTNKTLLQLNDTLKTNLTLMKVNFSENYHTISDSINGSLSDLPNYLTQLITDLNTNDDNFNTFTTEQMKNVEKIKNVNSKLNEFLIEYSIDYNSIINKFIEESISQKLDDLKTEFSDNFDQLLNKQFRKVNEVIDSEMRVVGSKIMQENKSTIIAKANNWNETTSNSLQMVKQGLQQYEVSVQQYSSNNQERINGTATTLRSNLNEIVSTKLNGLRNGFEKDIGKLEYVIPKMSDTTVQSQRIVDDNLDKFNSVGILGILGGSDEDKENVPLAIKRKGEPLFAKRKRAEPERSEGELIELRNGTPKN